MSSSLKKGAQALFKLTLLTDDINTKQKVLTLFQKLDPVGYRNDESSSFFSRDVKIQIMEFELLSKMRRTLGLPYFLSAVTFQSSVTDVNEKTFDLYTVMKNIQLFLRKWPEHFSIYSETMPAMPKNRQPNQIGIKEIVLGTGSDYQLSQNFTSHLFSNRIGTNLFDLDGLYLRSLPSRTTSLIFGYDNMSSIESTLPSFVSIGRSHSHPGQLRIVENFLHGFDVRLCSSAKPSPYFNEGSEAVLENTLAEIQSTRVLDITPGAPSKKFGNFGDCFSELREMAKNPMGFFSYRSIADAGRKVVKRDLSLKD